MDGSTVDMSPLKPRCREDSCGCSGMFQRVSCTLSVIWEPSLNGCKQTLNSDMIQPITWPCSTIRIACSAWITQSKGQVVSRSVTFCAGMTAFMVVVAQTKVGFLTGGRGQKFRALPEEERRTQVEEACSCNSCPSLVPAKCASFSTP